jgi:hypothetical protein
MVAKPVVSTSLQRKNLGCGKGQPGYQLNHPTNVQSNGNLLVGKAYTAQLGLQPGESAIKEAETVAMKRALMTFGNPFGLALYDSSRRSLGPPGHQPPQVVL